MATDLAYSSLQDIREEAGHQHINKLEDMTGATNGTNTVFYVGRTYIVDTDYDDTIDVGGVNGDVIVYDDNVAVTVSAVDVSTGAITLASAPAASSVMLATYHHSVLSDAKVGKFRDEAIDFVQQALSGIVDYSAWTTVPPVVQTIVRIYAAGLILIRDHGLNADLENTSKDGYKRLETARMLLKGYLSDVSSGSGATARVTVASRSDGNIFERETDLSTWSATVTPEDQFMRGE